MSDREAVLFANEAFYQAFNDRDGETMAVLWARGVEVACLHPGWPPLFGREDVLESWEGIFAGDTPPQISCHGAQPHIYGETATVLCYERIPENYLIATNVFFREGGLWKIVHHQAGPTHGAPTAEENPHRTPFN